MSDTSPIILGDEERLISELANVTLQTFFDENVTQFLSDVGAITATTAFGVPEGVIHIESSGGIASTLAFGTAEGVLNVSIADGIASTVAFGGDTEGVLTLEEVGAIASTTSIGTIQYVNLLIGGADGDVGGIASTATLSTDTGFQGGIFRALIYKDGEISGIGSTESMFVAGGIRVNPASRIATSATAGSQTLPSNPVGFISVNINGTDYKVPYYNT
jgi:hypothetical protein